MGINFQVESGHSKWCVLSSHIGRHLLVYLVGAPHVLTQDDEYNGYFIPAGTAVFPNHWCGYNHPLFSVLDIDNLLQGDDAR
jgi:hypothetical protein